MIFEKGINIQYGHAAETTVHQIRFCSRNEVHPAVHTACYFFPLDVSLTKILDVPPSVANVEINAERRQYR